MSREVPAHSFQANASRTGAEKVADADARRLAGCAFLIAALFLAVPVHAQTATSTEEVERRLKNEETQREIERQRNEPRVRIESEAVAPPVEEQAGGECVQVKRFVLRTPEDLDERVRRQAAFELPQDRFHFLLALMPETPGCFNHGQLVNLMGRMTAELLYRGYTTTRIFIPPQKASSGIFEFFLVPGIVEAVQLRPEGVRATLVNALSMQVGEVFNVREVERAIETLRRAPSQDVNFSLEPGVLTGGSVVVVTVTREKPWRLQASWDNGGSKATGRQQANLSLGVDALLALSDSLQVTSGHDAGFDGGKYGTSSRSITYTLPWKDWLFQPSYSSSGYFQRVLGPYQTFIYSGLTRGQDFKLSYNLLNVYGRTPGTSGKLTVYYKIGNRVSQTFIDDLEVGVQHRDVVPMELGANYQQFFGDIQLEFSAARIRNLRSDSPYRYDTTDTNIVLPCNCGGLKLRYLGNLHTQFSSYPLLSPQWISIGGRYSVRGFDGETPLVAEQGAYLRNEIEIPIGEQARIYAGVDAGRVYGANVENLLGDRLVGGFLGSRGSIKSVQYDFMLGRPIRQPVGFPGRRVNVFVSLSTAL